MTVVNDAPVEVPRFQAHAEWFVRGEHGGLHCLRAWAPAERLVAHWTGLMPHLPVSAGAVPDPSVDLALHDTRSGRRWAGVRLDLLATTEALQRARLPLAAFGGVEVSLATASDQLVLTPELLLIVYAATPRWPYLLEARGMVERQAMPAPQWRRAEPLRDDAPALMHALLQVVDRLALVEVHA